MLPFAAPFLIAYSAAHLVASPPVPVDPVPVEGASPDTVEVADVATTIAPRLLVSLTDGRSRLLEGGTVTYTLTVRNATLATFPEVVVSQLLPRGVRVRSAEGPYDIKPGEVTWHLSLAPGEERTLSVTGEVTAEAVADEAGPPRRTSRTATACVAPAPNRPLAACVGDSDVIGPAPARAAWAAVATAALTGIVVGGSAVLLRIRMRMTTNGGKARRWRLS